MSVYVCNGYDYEPHITKETLLTMDLMGVT